LGCAARRDGWEPYGQTGGLQILFIPLVCPATFSHSYVRPRQAWYYSLDITSFLGAEEFCAKDEMISLDIISKVV